MPRKVWQNGFKKLKCHRKCGKSVSEKRNATDHLRKPKFKPELETGKVSVFK